MYEEEIRNLLLRRKELMDELDPLYVNYEELKANGAAVQAVNRVARAINERVDEIKNIDAQLEEYQKKQGPVTPVEEDDEDEKHVIIETNKTEKKKYLTKGGIIALAAAMLATGVGATLLASRNKNCSGKTANADRLYTKYETDVETNVKVNTKTGASKTETTVTSTSTEEPVVETVITPETTIEPTVEPTIEQTVEPTVEPVVTPEVTPEPTVEPTVTPEPTVTTEPGLTDVTNEYDVEAAVDRIYEQDLNPMIEGLNNPAFEAQITREDIADIIRFVNGELPINTKYDESKFNDLASKFVYVYGAQGGHANELYPVHYENLAVKGSALAKYCKEYDDIYNKIAEYRAEGNVDGFVEEVGYLSSKLFNEWHKFGMYGGWNPYLFSDEEIFLAFNASVGRYANYVKEYLISNDLTVCINACVDVEKGEYKQVETRDIYEAMLYGTSKNNEISIMIGTDEFNPNAFVSGVLQNTLKEKSEQAVKSLK